MTTQQLNDLTFNLILMVGAAGIWLGLREIWRSITSDK
jgi:hypothetical protein